MPSARDLEGDLARVDVVEGPVDERDPNVDHGIAGEDARLHGFLDSKVDRRDVLLGDGAAGDPVEELVALARLGRLDIDVDVAVLAAAAGLPDEAALDLLDRFRDRLAVGDLRPA